MTFPMARVKQAWVGALCLTIVCVGDALASSELPPGLYTAAREDVVATGRTCGIVAPLVPAFVLKTEAAGVEGAPTAVAVLRDDAGGAMPLVPRSEADSYTLVDLTKPATSAEYPLGVVTVVQRAPALWVAVDYKRWDLDCQVTGTLIFAPVSDGALGEHVAALTRAFALAGQRDALRARADWQAALEMSRQVEKHLIDVLGADHVLALNAKAQIAWPLLDLNESKLAHQQGESVLPRLQAALGSDHPYVLYARTSLAAAVWRFGDLDAAEGILRDVIDRYGTLKYPDDRRQLHTLLYFAVLMKWRSRMVEAERMMSDIIVRLERTVGNDDFLTIRARNALGILLRSIGRHDDALIQIDAALERSSRVLGSRHPETLSTREAQLLLMHDLGRRAEAIERLRELLAIDRESRGPRNAITLRRQELLALMLGLEGTQESFAEGLALQREVVEAIEAIPGITAQETYGSHISLGRLESLSGDHASGVARLSKAYALAREILRDDDEEMYTLMEDLSSAQRRSGDLVGARDTLRRLVKNIEAWRETGATTSAGRRDLFAPWVIIYKRLAAVELALGGIDLAFDQSERSKARVLVEMLALRRGEARDVLPAEAIAKLKWLDQQLADVETELARAPREPSVRLPLEQRRASIGDEALALRRELRQRYAKYSALSDARVLTAADGARELPRDAVFVSYLREHERVMAFTVDRRGRLKGHDLGEISGLNDIVVAYRALLSASGRGPSAPAVWRLASGRYQVALAAEPGAVRVTDAAVIGAELAKRLIEPLPELVRARRWIISPDGALALIPFETLPFRGQPLVLAREITYAPSLTVYALTAKRARDYDRIANRAPLYAMGAARYQGETKATPVTPAKLQLATLAGSLVMDPEGVRRAYDEIGARWTDLPNSATELRQVAAHFRGAGPVTVRRFDEATEAQLIADDRVGMLANHRYVLLSAHGFLSTEAPSLSAVVLGQRDVTPEADGYVTAAEWTGYTLRSDLIVISACETGVGRVIEGEGVAGLPYALFVAGNRNALLTLWPVADRSTALFVSRFFGHLRAGLSQSAALTRTKREFASKGPYTQPLHWAPFVLWGS